jgi:aryl carrier-like protein
MGKTITLEHPELSCVRVDLDPESESAEVQAWTLFEEICSRSGEDQIAFRSQVRYVARLVRHSGRDTEIDEKPSFRADGTYLITGGLGGLGLLTASWLVEQGARSLVLVGRGRANEAARRQLENLEQAGATVTVAQADVSREDQVMRLLTAIEASLPPLRGIIHAAGVLDDGVLLQQTWERFSRVMAAKVMGSWNLHTLTQNSPLDFFVLFSSAASLLGSPGQANHGAANAFLDALAHHRRALGLPGLSLNWGAWSEIGSAAASEVSERAKMKGMGTITPRQGLRSFEQLFSLPVAQIGVVPIAWPTFIQQFQTGIDPPFLAQLAGEAREQVKGNQPTSKQGDLLSQWAATPPEERHSCLVAYIRRQVAKVLRLSTSELNVDVPLNCMGLDSLMAVELKNRIKIDSGIEVPLVKFMEDFTIISLTAEMNGQLAEACSSASTAMPAGGQQPATAIEISPQEAKRILAKLDQLTDDEVDTLLTYALGENEG